MADITTLNAATADINALEYLKRGMALIRDVDNCLRQNLASGAELAALNVAPVVPAPPVADMLGIMAIYQGAYEQSHAQYPNTVTWVPGVEILPPPPAQEVYPPSTPPSNAGADA